MCFGGGGGSDNSSLNYQKQQDAQARADEVARQGRITQGREQIDRLFDKGETLIAPAQTGQVHKDLNTIDPQQQQNMMLTAKYGGDPWAVAGATDTVQTAPATWGKTQPAFDQAFYDQRKQAYIDNQAPQLADQFSKARSDMTFALARAGLNKSSVAADQFARLAEKNTVESGTIANQAEADTAKYRQGVEDQRSNLVAQLQSSADPAGSANLALARTQAQMSEPTVYNPLGDVFSGVTSGIGHFISGAASVANPYRNPFTGPPATTGATQGTRTGG